jgi:hypothetical protein
VRDARRLGVGPLVRGGTSGAGLRLLVALAATGIFVAGGGAASARASVLPAAHSTGAVTSVAAGGAGSARSSSGGCAATKARRRRAARRLAAARRALWHAHGRRARRRWRPFVSRRKAALRRARRDVEQACSPAPLAFGPSAYAAPAAAQSDPPRDAEPPAIFGTVQEGETLTAQPGAWSGSAAMSYGFQWQRCDSTGGACADIARANARTYLADAVDVNSTLRVRVMATNSMGSTSASSPHTTLVQGKTTAPSNTSPPTISGTAQDGQTLKADPGSWNGTRPLSFAYQWRRCSPLGVCEDVAGATSKSYPVSAADVGSRLQVRVTTTNALGWSTATSAQTAAVQPKPTAPTNTSPPAISGTAQAGQTLTSSPGTYTGTQPISYAYRWRRCDADIAGASASGYTAVAQDVGSRLRVAVTATNAVGSATATTAATAAVTPASASDTTPPATPGGVTATAGDGHVALDWVDNSESDLAGYRVYRDGARIASPSSSAYDDTGLANGTSHAYQVSAVDKAGNESAKSAPLSATPQAASGGTPYPLRGIYSRETDNTFDRETALGFNLIDSDPSDLADVNGTSEKAMVWVGSYDHASCQFEVSDSQLKSWVSAHVGDKRIAVWYLSNEPVFGGDARCPDVYAQHKTRSDLIHSIDPNAKTLVVIDGNSGRAGGLAPYTLDEIPKWKGTTDIVGINAYICRQGEPCEYGWIDKIGAAAKAAGLNFWGQIQAFGEPPGQGFDMCTDSACGKPRLPSPDELHQEFNHWRATDMSAYLVFEWRWPSADSSLWLANHPELQSQLATENAH